MRPLPTWDDFLIPSLRVLSDGEVHRRRDIVQEAAAELEFTGEEKLHTVPSGQQTYVNRGNWAITHLGKAGLVTSPGRAQWKITDLGRDLLQRFPNGITEREFKEEMAEGAYADFLKPSVPSPAEETEILEPETGTLTALEHVEIGQKKNEEMVGGELLTRLRENDPAFFEQAVLDLLIAMGYGGSLGKATRTQLSNDGGIDGVIDQDALGLSRIYVQAKRYAHGHSVGRPEVQAFVGALHGAQANQGVFLTTSTFTPGAQQYADSVQLRVVLIDGALLTRLMIRHGVGTQIQRTINIVEIDEDFFE
ncbi:restriction endonuclease [Corynebacterium tuscaniense]|uniref:Restriction endonuclease n=1 Tax=Corynebacterium tuscaniense TaxID=302449 RepID=A0A2N6T4J7_9CORY|nr:restriction endonuclease [Corynebacterium tuscaniense]PMC64228.1 restriction endonuclease [Corynebacterium tuscaniense]